MGKNKRKRHRDEIISGLSDRLRELERRINKPCRYSDTDRSETHSTHRRRRSRSSCCSQRSRSSHSRRHSLSSHGSRRTRSPQRGRRSRSYHRRSRSPHRRHRSSRDNSSPHRSPVPHVNQSSPQQHCVAPAFADSADAEVNLKERGGDDYTGHAPATTPSVLPSEIEDLLGQEGTALTNSSIALHESLATRWMAILSGGLGPDAKMAILQKYSTPTNCSLLIPPMLNEEVAAAMNESGIKRDKRISDQQAVLAKAITCLGEVLGKLIATNGTSHVEPLSDAARLLCGLYHDNSTTRRSLILPGLNKDLKGLMEKTPISEFLFGDKLQDKVNACKAVKKSGQELKNTPPQPKPPPKARPLNFRGPRGQQMPRPSGQKPRQRPSTFNASRNTTRQRRSPPRHHQRRRPQDRR